MSAQPAVERQRPATRITHTYAKLPAKDVERARAFYDEKLGLSAAAEVHNHLHYEVAGVHLVIFPSTGESSGTHDQLGLVVEDLEAEMGRLKERGVTFESYPAPPGTTVTDGIMDAGHIKAAWFKDSEGNLISIAEFGEKSPFAA